eukprot:305004-Rhodomonas_salina.1
MGERRVCTDARAREGVGEVVMLMRGQRQTPHACTLLGAHEIPLDGPIPQPLHFFFFFPSSFLPLPLPSSFLGFSSGLPCGLFFCVHAANCSYSSLNTWHPHVRCQRKQRQHVKPVGKWS